MASLTIEKVHALLGKVLSEEAVALQNYVHRVSERTGIVGVILGADGVMYYDPVWWNENINSPEKAKHAVAFEILKKVLGADQRGRQDWIQRIATAMVINAYLYKAYGFSELPRSMYSAVDLPECLMRPFSRGYPSRLKQLYNGVWDRVERYTDIGNVARALRVLLTETTASLIPGGLDPNKIPVIGYQTSDGNSTSKSAVPNDVLPMDVVERMAEGMDKSAGFSDKMTDFVVKKIKERRTLQSKIVTEFAMDKIKRRVKKFAGDVEIDQTPVPKRLGLRDIFNLARGIHPWMFQNEVEVQSGSGGLAVYVDVSGSFHSWIPYAVGVVDSISEYVDRMYQFSNKIAETNIQDLRKKNVRIITTRGTDFDCVVRHAVDNKFNKIILITDGYAEVNDEDLRILAEQHIDKVLVILITHPPGKYDAVANNDDPNSPVVGTIKLGSSKAQVQTFLKNTWLGQHYGMCIDLSEAMR